MKKTALVIILFTTLFSCNSQQNLEIKLNIINTSMLKIDSVQVFDILNKKHSFYNVKPNDTITKIVKLKNFKYPNNDTVAFMGFTFFNGLYYSKQQGIIDPPFGLLKKEYTFYFWDEGFSSVLKPKNWANRGPKKINEFNLKKDGYFSSN